MIQFCKEWASTSHNWREYTGTPHPLYDHGNIEDYGFVVYWEVQEILGKPVPETFHDFQKVIVANVFVMTLYSKLAICCRSPQIMKLNEARRFHNLDGPAMLFRDGVAYYYINGQNIDPKKYHEMSMEERNVFLTNTQKEEGI